MRGAGGKSGLDFFFNMENELLAIQKELVEMTYQPSEYSYFKIYDPKERNIAVAPFRDRVVHHAIVGTLEPVYEKRYIYDSYATRKGKGTHRAIKRAQDFLRKNKWFLKTDVRRYFESIDHEILLDIIKRKIKDNKLLEIIVRIIRNGGQDGRGIPIGNLTSQFFANVYLDVLDHYLKDELGVKYYIRYMDDIVIFSDDRRYLKDLKVLLEEYLKNNLKLALKERSTFINQRLNGLSFLGRRIYPNLIRIKRENLDRCLRKLKTREKEYNRGDISSERFLESAASMMGYLSGGNTYNLRNRIFHGQLS